MERIFSIIGDMSSGARISLISLIVLGMAAYYYFVPYSSYYKELAKAKKIALATKRRFNAEKNRQREILKNEKKLAQLQEKIKELTKRLPSRVGMSELVGELDQMAEDIKIKSIRPKEDDTKSIPMVVIKPIELKVEGKFHSICRFLYKMFQMNRLMDVGDIHIRTKAKNNKDSAISLVEASFIARIYYSPLSLPTTNKEKGGKGLMDQGMRRLTNPNAKGGMR